MAVRDGILFWIIRYPFRTSFVQLWRRIRKKANKNLEVCFEGKDNGYMKKLIHAEAIKELDLNGLLEKISKVKIGILGDLCLDVYWHADMRQSELSRETPHYPLPVVEERFSLGGAANVCANAAALGAICLLHASLSQSMAVGSSSRTKFVNSSRKSSL